MIALFKGLGLLLHDNALRRQPLETQAAHWRDRSEAELDAEVELLGVAKQQWLIASIIVWQAISLILLGVLSHQLWQHDFHLTFGRVVIVFTVWLGVLFVLWYIADRFDHSAGFERWLRAFNSRARLSPHADSVESLAEALDMARRYPEVLHYKQQVKARRELRHQDLVNMRELGRMHLSADILRDLDHYDGPPRRSAHTA